MPQPIEIFLNARAQEAASSPYIVGFRNAEGDEPAEILLDGIIGDRFDANDSRSVTQFLRDNKGKAVRVWINSPGGLAYDGITMHNALMHHDGPVTTIIAGMAGSAASIVAMAGSRVQMYENASLFIHRAAVMAMGNADVMAEASDWLSKIDEAIARTYKARTGAPIDQIRRQMKGKVDGTVFSAQEAKAGGWIDEILKPNAAAKVKNAAGLNARLMEAYNLSLRDGRFTSACTCTGDAKRAVVAFGSKLAEAKLRHGQLCPVRQEHQAGFEAFAARHAGKDEQQLSELKVSLRRGDALAKCEAVSAERVRTRKWLVQ